MVVHYHFFSSQKVDMKLKRLSEKNVNVFFRIVAIQRSHERETHALLSYVVLPASAVAFHRREL